MYVCIFPFFSKLISSALCLIIKITNIECAMKRYIPPTIPTHIYPQHCTYTRNTSPRAGKFSHALLHFCAAAPRRESRRCFAQRHSHPILTRSVSPCEEVCCSSLSPESARAWAPQQYFGGRDTRGGVSDEQSLNGETMTGISLSPRWLRGRQMF